LEDKLTLKCPKCGKKAGRATKKGRVCLNCGHTDNLDMFIVKE